ncbi:Ser-tRNA(Thr) hydrolase; threonyl-tRNA synthetase [Coriobacterium glomerans PW2]|uniref:Threonine--tRNA ligase n=1 Tax=Coriobacterium glomerans (strain ATCC 49209 / DSM 20642 / JCM 10262 / PW2) TaxID=700015 RepID=F2N7N6_CORGP|nr:threonine--tRNA ligase [Coriobacterium glomerans]AEB06928.1 Ser-tRNA(Thr) hydrolase; threonyl-tRNA synthetase [Coriobacterium glomerans PW2]
MRDQISVRLPDGSQRELPAESTLADLAASIGAGLARAALAGKVNGEIVDLARPLACGDEVEILTNRSGADALAVLRHSAAHILAAAMAHLYGDVVFGTGPAIEDGFYYDMRLPRSISPDDFSTIEAEMKKIVAADLPFVREEVGYDEARRLLADQPLKLELIAEHEANGDALTIYRVGDFIDLCAGPHLSSTGMLKAFSLTKLAGAYWRANADNEMLTRLYGTAFFSKRDLEEHLFRLEEAAKRDHKKLGRELGIFTMFDEAGPGLPLYLPAGARVIRLMETWLSRELYRRGYQEVITPHIYKSDVWKTSGHYGYYRDNMYFFNINEGTAEEPRLSEFGVKPMNCPGHVLIYKNDLHSYRELPIRYFEFGTVYRHELSGAVNGLFRARGFTQDDAHVFCREDQVIDEIDSIMDTVDFIMGTFELPYTCEISTRPDKSIGGDDMWEKAERFLAEALDRRGIPFEINAGDGAFYGPKIDVKVKDSLGRTWQCSTIQVDFNLPERFDLSYRTADNDELRPWMLHRAIFGSIDRFLGIVIEHTAGNFPLWLAPVQCAIIPIADRHLDYACEIKRLIEAAGGRAEVAEHNEPMRAKIARAEAKKVPYMLVVGDKEAAARTVSVREHSEGDRGSMPIDEFLSIIEAARV